MTYFGATKIMHGTNIFIIQCYVYHLAGYLLSSNPEKLKILHIYFTYDWNENEIKRRLFVVPNIDTQIFYDLQYMLYRNNSYIRHFKSAFDMMPSNATGM